MTANTQTPSNRQEMVLGDQENDFLYHRHWAVEDHSLTASEILSFYDITAEIDEVVENSVR